MEGLLTDIAANAGYFVLLLLRMAGLVLPSPLFGRVGVPAPVKIGFAGGLSLLAFTAQPPPADLPMADSLLAFFLACLGELLIGIVIAYALNLFFALPLVGGQLIDMQIGFGIVNVYDPQNNTQIPMTGNLLNLMLLIVFWGVDGHHRLLALVFGTLRTLPPGHAALLSQVGLTALEVFCKSFALGVQVALPILASGIVIELCFGALMRTVPQLNMFVVGMPLKLLIGLLLLLITLPAFAGFSAAIFDGMYQGIDSLLGAFYAA